MPEHHRPRALVLDMATNRVGEVRDSFTKDGRPAVWLRPRGGGREWTAFRDDLRVVARLDAACRTHPETV